MFDFFSRCAPAALSLLRIVSGLLFLEHGLTKLFGFPYVEKFYVTHWASLEGASGILELVGGALLVLGLFTRPVAFLLSGEMAIAYFMVHAPQGFFPILNGGELAILYCFIYLYLAAAGSGPFSLDAVIARRRS